MKNKIIKKPDILLPGLFYYEKLITTASLIHASAA
tara:strand:+ start:1120 stop:1224 length:105 start_codon:yes stop_codon:yes gene_type:complete